MKMALLCWLAAAGSLQAFQAAAPPAPPATASIEGQVFNLQTGAPLKRANVRLTMLGRAGRGGQAGGGNVFNSGRGPGAQARETDEQGRFSFPNLEAGRYYLSAERQGFLRVNYGGRKYNTSGTPIVLGADQHMTGVVLKMSPQSVIAGKVLDEDGEPVASVQVRALKMGYRSGKKQWVQAGNGTTSDIGEYRIPALEPGRYLVTTNQSNRSLAMNMMRRPDNSPLPDAPDTRYAATYYPSTADQSTAVPVDVTPGGEVRGIDIRLVKTQVFRVRGRVAAPEGAGRFPMVMLISRDGSRTVPSMGPARPPDYRFEIAGVAPGSYIAVAQTGGRGEQSIAWQQVEVRGGHVDGLVLAPVQGADVSGTVKVEDASGPVDLSRVNIALRPTIADLGNAPRARVGGEGTFAMKNVAPMQYTVSVNGVPEGCWVKSIRHGGQEVPAEGATITGGAIEITLSATAGDIAVAAVDKDGNAVAGATVALLGPNGPIQGNTADENGGVSFRGLKPGDYSVVAWDDVPQGAHMDPEFVKNYPGTSVKLEPRGKPAVQVKTATVQ